MPTRRNLCLTAQTVLNRRADWRLLMVGEPGGRLLKA